MNGCMGARVLLVYCSSPAICATSCRHASSVTRTKETPWLKPALGGVLRERDDVLNGGDRNGLGREVSNHTPREDNLLKLHWLYLRCEREFGGLEVIAGAESGEEEDCWGRVVVGRLHAWPVSHVIDITNAAGVKRSIAVAAAWRTPAHALLQTQALERSNGIGSVDRGAPVDGSPAIKGARQVGHLMLHAVGEPGTGYHDEGGPPCVQTERPIELIQSEPGKSGAARQTVVEQRLHGIAERMRSQVFLTVVCETETEGVRSRLPAAGRQQTGEILDERRSPHSQAGIVPRQRGGQLSIGEPADVVQIEGIGAVVRTRDVVLGPAGGQTEISSPLHTLRPLGAIGACHLSGAQLQVVLPGAFGIVVMWAGGEQLPNMCGPSQSEDVPARPQAAAGQ